jgi:hypothetical protein
MWAADQRSSWDLYFRADDVDLATCQAREFRKLKNFPTIDVLAPEHVQTIASIANLKTACMQAYAAASVDRDGMSFFNEDLDAAYDEFAELVWQGSDDVAKLRTAAHDARRLTACNFKASRAHSAIEAALSQVDRDLELGRIPTPLDADDEAALRIAGL